MPLSSLNKSLKSSEENGRKVPELMQVVAGGGGEICTEAETDVIWCRR